jgi:uncharacterized protein
VTPLSCAVPAPAEGVVHACEEELVSPAAEDGAHVVLGEPECRELLAGATLGRLAFTDGALPVVVPVPYALHDEHVVLATRRGSAMAAAVRRAVVAFVVDSFGEAGQDGWAVTAVGPSRLVTRPSEVTALDRLQRMWRVPIADRCYVAVRPDLLSGWRTAPPEVTPFHSGPFHSGPFRSPPWAVRPPGDSAGPRRA